MGSRFVEQYSYGASDIFTCSVLDDVDDANLSVYQNPLEGGLNHRSFCPTPAFLTQRILGGAEEFACQTIPGWCCCWSRHHTLRTTGVRDVGALPRCPPSQAHPSPCCSEDDRTPPLSCLWRAALDYWNPLKGGWGKSPTPLGKLTDKSLQMAGALISRWNQLKMESILSLILQSFPVSLSSQTQAGLWLAV